jgi:hypothetical protein
VTALAAIPDQPGAERGAAPLVRSQAGERLVEHLGGDVFGRGAVLHPAGDEGIHPLKMPLVEIAEFRRVPLGSFDKKALVCVRLRHVCTLRI